MYATDVRQTDVRQHHRLMPPAWGIINDHTKLAKRKKHAMQQ